jgi:hypothetical protein
MVEYVPYLGAYTGNQQSRTSVYCATRDEYREIDFTLSFECGAGMDAPEYLPAGNMVFIKATKYFNDFVADNTVFRDGWVKA